MRSRKAHILLKIYERLYACWGPQRWWPAQSVFEVMVGAILTQNTAWINVEKAINRLKERKYLDPEKMLKLSHELLADAIKPAGYYNIKAKRLKNYIRWYQLQPDKRFKKRDVKQLRCDLLKVNGVGPETADSILLYAMKKKTFVVDAYTKRILERHDLIDVNDRYDEVKRLFENSLPSNLQMYNEYHALIVKLGKDFCRKKPLCHLCPLEDDLKKVRRGAKYAK